MDRKTKNKTDTAKQKFSHTPSAEEGNVKCFLGNPNWVSGYRATKGGLPWHLSDLLPKHIIV